MIIIFAFLQQLNKAVDLSVGFSMANTTSTHGNERVIPLGIQFGATARGDKRIGVEADLGIQAGTPAGLSEEFTMFEYLFGPRFSAHTDRATFFCHTLVGGVHYWQNGPSEAPNTYEGGGFAMAYGGGVDINASKRIAIRAVQFDWIPFRDEGSWRTNTMRFGFGIVFRATK